MSSRRLLPIVLLLVLCLFQAVEYYMAKEEVDYQRARAHRLVLAKQKWQNLTRVNKALSRHVFFSAQHNYSSSTSRESALSLLHPQVSVLYFDAQQGAELPTMFLEAMSTIPDAATYTYFNGSSEFEFSLTMLDTLASAVFADTLSTRFVLYHPALYFFTASRTVWDWNLVPKDADLVWLVDKAASLGPIISLVDVSATACAAHHHHHTPVYKTSRLHTAFNEAGKVIVVASPTPQPRWHDDGLIPYALLFTIALVASLAIIHRARNGGGSNARMKKGDF